MFAVSAPARLWPRPFLERVFLVLAFYVFFTGAISRSLAQAPIERAAAGAEGLRVNPVRAPLTFEQNLGQDASAAQYIAYGPGYLLRLEASRASIVCGEHTTGHLAAGASSFALDFTGANAQAKITAAEPQAGTHSYFLTSDKAHWLPGVATYSRVQYAGVYPGIDLSFYGNQSRLEYDFVVQQGGDAKSIRMTLDGAEQVTLDEAGGLSMRASGSRFTLLKPVAYQVAEDGVTREPVEAAYRLVSNKAAQGHKAAAGLEFSVGKYDRRRPLVIDPVLLYGLDIPGAEGYSYPPYYFADTVITAMTVDAAGNTYVAATVSSSNSDTSVMKFDPSGHLLYNVSLGSPTVYIGVDAIAIDAAGDVYLAGSAWAGLPTTPNALEPVSGLVNGYAGFLTVIKADASALLYSSYLGSSVGSTINGLAVDAKGKAYVTGSTTSSSFPTTPGVFETTTAANYQNIGFVAKFDPTLSGQASLVYSTFLASQSNESNIASTGYGIAVDAGGNAYVISAGGAGFPTTAGAYQYDGISPAGAYLTKLNATATAPVYSAFLGPGNPKAIALDGDAEAYVTGSANSGEFPTTTGAYQATYPGGFALKLSADGTSLLYSTFLGGPSALQSYDVSPTSIAVTPGCVAACNAYIAGTTASLDFPLVSPIQSFPGTYMQAAPSGQIEEQGFLVDLASNGDSAAFSTYLGAANSPTPPGYSTPAVAADGSGNLYFASNVQGPDAPVSLPAVQDAGEGFLLKIGPANAGLAVATPNHIAFSTQAVHSTGTPSIVELRNMGSAAITLTRPFVFNSKEFTETDNCGSTLAGGGLCTLQVSFTPAATGVRSGTLTVGYSGAAVPAVVALSGFAHDGPNLVISTAALTFADQVVDGSGVTQVVTVTNSGDQPQPIIAITTDLPDYVPTSTCGTQIAVGASCNVSILFKPTQIGLRSDSLYIEIPSGAAPSYSFYTVPMTGTGVLGLAGTGAVTLSQSSLNFASIVVGAGATQGLTLINSGDTPVTINAITVTTSKGGASDFKFVLPNLQGGYPGSTCGEDNYYGSSSGYALPYTLAPQSSCSIDVSFAPSVASQETGTLTLADSAAGSPQTVGLSGVGLISVQALTVTPATLAFPAQPVGYPSAAQTFTLSNGGEDYVLIDRVTTTGDFAIDDLVSNTCEEATLGPLTSCTVSVAFNPTATGSRTGTLVLLDTVSGTPQVFNLAGTGIQATGALQLGQTSLAFPAQAMGTSSATEELILSNPGNSPITINSLVATGDFAIAAPYYYNYYDSCGGVLAPASTCQAEITFSPTKASGQETGTLTIHSTVGNDTVNLSGTAFTASQAIHLTPTQANFGSVVFAPPVSGSSQITAFIENTGSSPVAFSTAPTISGTGSTPAADFVLTGNNCYPSIPFYSYDPPGSLPVGQNCSFTITFTPSTAGTEQATLSFVDSAGTQTMALTGTGVSTAPAVSAAPAMLVFAPQPLGSSSNSYSYNNYFYIYNYGATPLVINSETVSAGSSDFSLYTPNGSCAGRTIAPNGSCYSSFVFTPSAVGYRTGTVSYVSSTGTTYTAALAGYAIAEVNTASLSPQSLVLPSAALNAGSPAPSQQPTSITLMNTGNAPLVVGTVSGSNVSVTGDFTIAYGDGCSGVTVQPGSACNVSVGFTPRATGVRTGSLAFPVTYADKTTASLTAGLSGTGLTRVASGSLLPQTMTYPAQVAGLDTYAGEDEMALTLTNSGTVQLTPGTLIATNLGATPQAGSDFVLAYNQCTTPLAPGASCEVQISFEPINRGPKTAYITIPVTYAGGGTGSFTSKLIGNSVAPAPALQLSQAALNFNVEVVGTTDINNVQTAVLASVGNVPVTITSITASANFTVTSNQCGNTVSQQNTCGVTVAFTPLATTAPGQVNGTLTVVDNAPGSPHVIKLGGTAISTAQQLALSQTSVMFPSQPAGTVSAPQVVYLTDLGSSGATQGGAPSRVQIDSIKLGGADVGDFTETENCGGTLGFTIAGRQGCMITVAFAPASIAQGTRTATVTITPAQGAPLVIQLVGVANAEAKKAPFEKQR